MTKIFALALLLLPCLPRAAAAQAGPAVIVVVDEYDNEVRYNLALWHALQLKKAGLPVSVVLEGEAVLNLLPVKKGRLAKKSPNSERLAFAAKKGAAKRAFGDGRGAELLKELRGLGVPVVACSLSAVFYGEYEALKAAGAPLSADAERPVDLAALARGGYQLLVF